MTDDIVTRLMQEIGDSSSDTSMTLLAEAADEIIRLREELEAAHCSISGFIQTLGEFGKR